MSIIWIPEDQIFGNSSNFLDFLPGPNKDFLGLEEVLGFSSITSSISSSLPKILSFSTFNSFKSSFLILVLSDFLSFSSIDFLSVFSSFSFNSSISAFSLEFSILTHQCAGGEALVSDDALDSLLHGGPVIRPVLDVVVAQPHAQVDRQVLPVDLPVQRLRLVEPTV